MNETLRYEKGSDSFALSPSSTTIAVIGCGHLGTALIAGLVNSALRPFLTIYAISRTSSSIAAARAILKLPHSSDDDVASISEANQSPSTTAGIYLLLRQQVDITAVLRNVEIVFLAVPPRAANDVLSKPGVRDALRGKILVSLLGGVSISELEAMLYSDHHTDNQNFKDTIPSIHIVRCIASTAMSTKSSIMFLFPSPLVPPNVITRILCFMQYLGPATLLPSASLIPAATALCASGIAFFAAICQGAADGTRTLVEDEQRKAEEQEEEVLAKPEDILHWAAQTMRGAADLILSGKKPDQVITEVATKGGSTEKGLQTMKDLRIAQGMGEAIKVTARVHSC